MIAPKANINDSNPNLTRQKGDFNIFLTESYIFPGLSLLIYDTIYLMEFLIALPKYDPILKSLDTLKKCLYL